MRKFIFMFTALCLLVPSLVMADSYERLWWASSATGGGSGSMDGAISGVSINATDACIVVDSNKNAALYKVALDSASEYAVNGVYQVVAPDDVGAGATRWHLTKIYAAQFDFRSGTTIPTLDYVNAGASKYFVYSGVTLTADMLAGGMLYLHHTGSPIVLGWPLVTTGSTAFAMVKDMTGSGVTVQTTDGQTLYGTNGTGTAYFLNAGNSRGSATFTSVSESGSSRYVDVIGENKTWIAK